MKRRDFIKNIGLASAGTAMLGTAVSCNTKKKLKFGLCTDVHCEMLNDTKGRLQKFIDTCKKEKVDFMLDMGDFCQAKESSRQFVDVWQGAGIPTYNVLGNHDMDVCTKEEHMKFIGMEKAYYSFDKGDFHFVVLDPNNLLVDGKYIPYGNANFYRDSSERAFVTPEQLDWLKKDLEATKKKTIVFSHQSFQNPTACKNRDEVRKIFEDENKRVGYNKVVASFSGHDHTDMSIDINGIQYIQINSMTYSWIGQQKAPEGGFSEEYKKISKFYDRITIYKDGLFAIVELDESTMKVNGVQSQFCEPTPQDRGLNDGLLHNTPLVATVTTREFKF
jgi:3',5'-cyclic AMP phosphodiesterase CpdA